MTQCSFLDDYIRTLIKPPDNLATDRSVRPLWRIMVKHGNNSDKYYLEVRANGDVFWNRNDNLDSQQFYFDRLGLRDFGNFDSREGNIYPPPRTGNDNEVMYHYYIRSHKTDNYLTSWRYSGNYPIEMGCRDASATGSFPGDRNKLWCISNVFQNGVVDLGNGYYREDAAKSRSLKSKQISNICNAFAINFFCGYSKDLPKLLQPAAPETPFNRHTNTLYSVPIWDGNTFTFNSNVLNTYYLVLERAPPDLFGECVGANTLTSNCITLCNGTDTFSAQCRTERDKWCGVSGGTDTISDNCVNALVGRNIDYNSARESACKELLNQNQDLTINNFLEKYSHCSCFLGKSFYDNFLNDTLSKNPDFAASFANITRGECIFPQCAVANNSDKPFSFTCPALTICIETANVSVDGTVNGNVNIKQSVNCTSSITPNSGGTGGSGTGGTGGSGTGGTGGSGTGGTGGSGTGGTGGSGDSTMPGSKTQVTNIKLASIFAVVIGVLFFVLLILLIKK